MSQLKCSECGAPATVEDGQLVRTCEHDGPVTADLSAVVYGDGGAN